MGFNDIISKIFGNKAQRDLKEVNPVVKRVQEAYAAIEELSDDGLREKTKELEKLIHAQADEKRAQIEQLKTGMEEIDLDEREVSGTGLTGWRNRLPKNTRRH